jgi:hypothetical protein
MPLLMVFGFDARPIVLVSTRRMRENEKSTLLEYFFFSEN